MQCGVARPLCYIVTLCLLILVKPVLAQNDSTPAPKDTFFLLKYKGLLGKLAKSIVADTSQPAGAVELLRNDLAFQRYKGRIIRDIEVRGVKFGTPISDTSRRFTNSLIKMADFFHHNTRGNTIRNNLFFRKNDKVWPYLLADNERHLRNLEYLGDARITIRKVPGTEDSVDIIVLTKDVLSLGGSFNISSLNKTKASVKEENFFGWGDKLEISGLYDRNRHQKFGYGGEYIKRNIGGSFIDGSIMFKNFYPTINTARPEETIVFGSLLKPLVHPYMLWTYAIEGGVHTTKNMYVSDSLYQNDFRYSYFNIDAWAAYNLGVPKPSDKQKDERLRTLLGARVVRQQFRQVPQKYENEFFFRYQTLSAVLGSLSIFRQDFYKTRYIYGFGRNEDVPQGLDVSLTTGWTSIQERVRTYTALSIEFNYFSRQQNYFNYRFRAGGFVKDKKYEDIDLLLNVDFFSNLRRLGKWKQRTFVTLGITRQFNKVLNEPLFLDSEFGLTEFRNDSLFGGDFRSTLKAESVFFPDWSLLSFKFAPFVFGHASVISGNKPEGIDRHLFTSIGAGVRTRNESLVFRTIELKGFYFPRRNFYNEHFRVEISTNVKFKYNQQKIRRPDFIQTN